MKGKSEEQIMAMKPVRKRKSWAGWYLRTRNSLSNYMWPCSSRTFVGVFTIWFVLLLVETEPHSAVGKLIWKIGNEFNSHENLPKWSVAFINAVPVSVISFFILVKARQLFMRFLFSYRRWMYESPKNFSLMTKVWYFLVRITGNPSQSLLCYQLSLPRMTIPSLHNTLEKWLQSQAPLCKEPDLEKLEKEAFEFEKNLGWKLQLMLHVRSWWTANYVRDLWDKYLYLSCRSALPHSSNYGALGNCYWSATTNHLARAAGLTSLFLEFKRLVDREELPPLVVQNTVPLCMEQYTKLFCLTRVPGKTEDRLISSKDSQHIIVTAKGMHYQVQVYDAKNRPLHPAMLEEQFRWIWMDATQKSGILEEQKAIAACTALPRSEWAEIRSQHLSTGVNKQSLEAIESAIFVVVLSSDAPDSLTDRGRWLICGDNKSIWYDKSFNVVVFANGQAGLNVEHAPADGLPLAHMWEYALCKEILTRIYSEDGHCVPPLRHLMQRKVTQPSFLSWDVSQQLAEKIHHAVDFAQKNSDDFHLEVADFKKFGKGFMKQCKVSPDAFIQLAIQFTYFKDSGRFAQTYESSVTRLFALGRTETVRSCTTEAAHFVRAMTDITVNISEKLKLFLVAVNKHQNIYRDAMNGLGIDRHLFALYVCSKYMGYKNKFLEDLILKPWVLSTSQTPQHQMSDILDPNIEFMQEKSAVGGSFSAVTPEGYGISYMVPSDHRIFFHVSSYRSCSSTDSTRFMNLLFESLQEMRDMIESAVNSQGEFCCSG